jgi:ABC-type transport system substrate-binding protein
VNVIATKADYAKAKELLEDSGIPGGYGPYDSYVRDIAQALAEARDEGRRQVGDFLRGHLSGESS